MQAIPQEKPKLEEGKYKYVSLCQIHGSHFHKRIERIKKTKEKERKELIIKDIKDKLSLLFVSSLILTGLAGRTSCPHLHFVNDNGTLEKFVKARRLDTWSLDNQTRN